MIGELILIQHALPAPGLQNMRLDWELLAWAEELPNPCTCLRFYGWSEPTVSLGKHQQPENAVDLDFCHSREIPVVHRPTGGRAVLHQDEMTYALVSNSPELTAGRGVQGTYERVAEALVKGFRRLGLEPELARQSKSSGPGRGLVTPCFVTASRLELMVQGRKLAGSAQRRLKRAFLQHGSIPLTIDYALMEQIFRTPAELLKSRVSSLAEVLGRRPGFGEVREALKTGFEEALGRVSHPLALEQWRESTASLERDREERYGIV